LSGGDEPVDLSSFADAGVDAANSGGEGATYQLAGNGSGNDCRGGATYSSHELTGSGDGGGGGVGVTYELAGIGDGGPQPLQRAAATSPAGATAATGALVASEPDYDNADYTGTAKAAAQTASPH